MIAVTHLITGLEVGGAEVMLARLVTHSDRRKFRHRVISLREPGDMAKAIQAAGIPVASLHMKSGIPDPRAAVNLRRLLRQDLPDVLQSWMYHANLLATVVSSVVKVPLIWNMRAVAEFDYGRQVAVIDAALSRMARIPAAVVVNSEHGRAHMASHGYAGARWKVIPNGFDTDHFQPDAGARKRVRSGWGIHDERLIIGLVARHDPVKDHPTFLEAVHLLARNDATTQFVCVGGGNDSYFAQLQNLASSLGIADRVLWAGARTDIAAVNSALDVATCCSISESFPNVVGEAMACGVPCVVTDVGDAARLVGNTGIVVQPRAPSDLAEAWQTMLAVGPAFRSELGTQARQRIQRNFSLDRIVAEYEDLYESVANHV